MLVWVVYCEARVKLTSQITRRRISSGMLRVVLAPVFMVYILSETTLDRGKQEFSSSQ